MRASLRTGGDGNVHAEHRSWLLPAYRFGQVLAVILAGLLASTYGVMAAAAGLMVALVLFRVVFGVVRGVVFPLIEITSGAVGRALVDE